MRSTHFAVILVTVLLFQWSGMARAQTSTAVGQFENQSDIGKVKRPGSAAYNAARQEYTVEGSGVNMWFNSDQFHMVWKRMKGDFILQTTAHLLGKGVDPHRKLGWIVRSGLDSSAAHINAAVHGDGLTSLQFRRTAGGTTEEKKSTLTAADVIQLARHGNTYTMSVASHGQPFVSEEVTDLNLGDDVYVGLFVCSHNPDVSEKALFTNVRVIVPARDNFVPYREYIGSCLELMDVASGQRTVIYQSPESLQAPNWLPNNKALLYNSKGGLYRFDLKTKTPTLINSDFASNNNNDHVLSFDGKQLGISHHSKDDNNQSVVYTMPTTGGKPKRVTPVTTGPSYLHGWSPDSRELVYTAQRNGEFDIYKISADGGQEVKLTEGKPLDDGPEFSPDGKYIYFNSTRTGTMQIWRMKADGSEEEQITNDGYNNWFPHISPDGKWMTILSFGTDVKPDDHPFYKQVYLRLLPIVGGNPAKETPKVIAYIYGGQGTINTPSWSPDSKRVSFISNTSLLDIPGPKAR